MPVYLETLNLDEEYEKAKQLFTPLILNDLDISTEESRERLNSEISSMYSYNKNENVISLLPQCNCGNIKGEYNLNVICNKCNTKVTSKLYQDIHSYLWVRKPNGVAKLINPSIWYMLGKIFTKSKFNVLMWICDNRYNPDVKEPVVMNKVRPLIPTRSYNYFVEYFDEIINNLLTIKDFNSKNKREVIYYLKTLISNNRNIIFSDYVPVPNKEILVIEITKSAIFVELNTINATDQIKNMTGIDLLNNKPQIIKESRAIRYIDKMSMFYRNYYARILSQKEGLLRKHVYGSRGHMTWRTVITSITDKHDYRELHIPWFVGMTIFRPHLLNKLINRGYELKYSLAKLKAAIDTYDELLHELFNEILDEAKQNYIGIPALANRNPSLLSASMLALYASKIKTNPRDKTTGISILVIGLMGGDGIVAMIYLII